jgi:serine phosphatase RsbU (regulator of sigma subunit)/PAS domain-containing protein
VPDPAPQTSDAPRVRLGLAFDAAGAASFEYDLHRERLVADERLARLFGHPADTSARGYQDRLEDVVVPGDLARFRAAVTEAVRSGEAFHSEFRVRRPDGTPGWIGVRGRVLHEGTTPQRLLGVAYDTTRDHVLDLASALESLPAAYYALDEDRVLRHLNAEAERLLARPRAELIGRGWGDVFPLAAGSQLDAVLLEVARTGRAASVELLHPEPLALWCELRAWPDGEGTSVLLLPSAARRAAEEAASRAALQVQVLAGVGAHLSGTLDAETAVARLSGVLVPVLGDWCIVTLVDEQGGLRDVGTHHADPARQALLDDYTSLRMPALLARGGSTYVADAARSGRPVVLPEPAVDAICAVLGPGTARDRARGRTVGFVTLARDHGRRGFDSEDVATASGVAERAALALDNARLYGEQQKMAEGLQRDLLTPPAQSPRWQTAVRYLPAAQASQVGGDWYDAFHQPDGSTMLVIGDVVGHDTRAAAAMGQLRNLLRGIAFAAPDGPAGLLSRLDAAMAGLGVGTLATALVGRLEPQPDGVFLEFSSAGHPSPVMLRSGGGVVSLDVADGREGPDLLLGIDPTTLRHDGELLLRTGDTILFHTDGLVERRDQSLDVGTARLLDAVSRHAGLGLEELCDALLRDLLPPRPEDDVALVAVRIGP